MTNGRLVLAASALLVFAPLYLLLPTAPVGVLRPADLPIALPGTVPEPDLSLLLAGRAEASRHDGKQGDYLWEKCVDAVGVYSLPLPEGADDEWRSELVSRWARSNRWDHGIYKEGGDALYSQANSRYQFTILALPSQPQYLDPLAREIALANPDKLLVFGLALECPDPHPRWKAVAQSVLAWVGAR